MFTSTRNNNSLNLEDWNTVFFMDLLPLGPEELPGPEDHFHLWEAYLYNLKFDTHIGIARNVWNWLPYQDSNDNYLHWYPGTHPWWHTTEKFLLMDGDIWQHHWADPAFFFSPWFHFNLDHGNSILYCFNEQTVGLFSTLVDEQVPCTVPWSQCRHPWDFQRHNHVFDALWDPCCLTIQQKYQKIIPLWVIPCTGVVTTLCGVQHLGPFNSQGKLFIKDHHCCHIFLFHLEEWQRLHAISDLEFELFYARYKFENSFGKDYHRQPAVKSYIIKGLNMYLQNLEWLWRIQSRQLNILNQQDNTFGNKYPHYYSIEQLSTHILNIIRLINITKNEIQELKACNQGENPVHKFYNQYCPIVHPEVIVVDQDNGNNTDDYIIESDSDIASVDTNI